MQLTTSPVDLRPDIAWKRRLGSWSIYAAAAGATLATASRADADIMYSGPQDVTDSIPTAVTSSFSIKRFNVEGYRVSIELEALGLGGNQTRAARISASTPKFQFVEGAGGYARKYAASQPIRATGALSSSVGLRMGNTAGARIGPFGPGTVTGFVGFKAANGTLGWIRITVADVDGNGTPDELEAIDWAYNNTPGGPINAGQISSVPEPSSVSLALLAIGASGLIAWRRRRREQHAQ